MNVIKLDDFPLAPVQGQIYEIIPDKSKIVASTNRLFNKYPTRYISAVPRFAISAYSKKGDTILDPFCGSGTTAIESMLLGRNAVSIDIDPFARLLIKVKTSLYSKEDLALINEIINILRVSKPDSTRVYPMPDIPDTGKWFCDEAVLWLSYFKSQIDALSDSNDKVRDYLYVVLAAIIRKVSNADEVSPKPYISKRYPKKPGNPYELFLKTEAIFRSAILSFSNDVYPLKCQSIVLDSNDARIIECDKQIDLAVTSPPYINAYDYVRSLRFENLWLGLASNDDLKVRRKSYIGTEISKSFYKNYVYASQSNILLPIVENIAKIDTKRADIVNTYFEDMAKNMCAVSQKLKNGGRYVIVVGDSNIRGQIVPTAQILAEIAEQLGYKFELSFKYIIRDRYLHLPRGGRGGIIKYDEILVLQKTK